MLEYHCSCENVPAMLEIFLATLVKIHSSPHLDLVFENIRLFKNAHHIWFLPWFDVCFFFIRLILDMFLSYRSTLKCQLLKNNNPAVTQKYGKQLSNNFGHPTTKYSKTAVLTINYWTENFRDEKCQHATITCRWLASTQPLISYEIPNALKSNGKRN